MHTITPRRLLFTLPFLLLLGCPMAPVDGDGGTSGGGTGNTGGGTSNTGGGGGSVATAPDGGVLSAPQLTSASGQVVGRTGRDLRVSIVGKDRNLDIVTATARLLDASGNPVRDGSLNPVTVAVTLDTKKWVGETLTASGLARGLFDSVSGVAQVAVTLVDSAGLASEELTGVVTDQEVKASGDGCDPTFVANRCAPSLGCRGTPATCQEGLAPTIARMGFFRSAGGPLILLEGVEPEDDLARIHFEFQTTGGAPVQIDSDGNGSPDLGAFDYETAGAAVDGAYFIRLQGGVDLDQQVPVLVATAIDAAGHASPVKKVSPTTPPTRTAGQACDPRGFDACGPNLICAPGIVGATNKCMSVSSVHTAACSAAPVLMPTASGATLIGVAEGASMYDAPAGCSSNDPTGRPDAIVTIRLASRADVLTLTTARPGTTFDTTLYLLQACPADASNALSCNDDGPDTSSSTLQLTDMPAGDYQLVIDSFGFGGGTFELQATVQ